uniref:Ig-like domain-containing protein n=1 Tax=Varanus komodoensis TaxID=61221 RepID=A0A8D2L952_VARKO
VLVPLVYVAILSILLTVQRVFERTHGDSVTQTALISIQEGQAVVLPCTYETTDSLPTLLWYEQCPSEAPRLLLSSFDDQEDEKVRQRRRGFSEVKEKKFFNLTKGSVELRDSAVYFCAMRHTVASMTRRARQKPTQWQGTGLLHC